jgi:hypothetical protein
MVSLTGSGWENARYGFHFQEMKVDAILPEAPYSGFTIAYCEYRNLYGTVFNACRFFTTYTGEDSTLAWNKTNFRFQLLVHSGALYDAGIFQTFGNGTVCNIYRKDGRGSHRILVPGSFPA